MYSQIQDVFTDFFQKRKYSGVNMLIRKNGEEVFRWKIGLRDIENDLKIEYDTLFRLASMTKPVIAAGIMILAERKMLDIEDAIGKYIPAFTEMNVADEKNRTQTHPAERQIKIRDILGHCSGIGQTEYSTVEYQNQVCKNQSLEERVDIISRIPLDYEPGTCAGYSPLMGYDVLGRLIEVVSGTDLNSFVQQEICSPLKIKDMGYRLNDNQYSRLAHLYEASGGMLIDTSESDQFWNLLSPLGQEYFSGSGGMLGTLEAYDRFVQMLFYGGILDGKRILSEETVKKMHVNSSSHRLMMQPGIGWGLGMIIHENPVLSGRSVSPGTFGWSGAYGTHFFIDPIKRITAVMMMSVSNIGGADSPIAAEFEKCAEKYF